MQLLLLIFLITACNSLENPFGSSGGGDDNAEAQISVSSSGASNANRDFVLDSKGVVIGRLETRTSDLNKDFTVVLEDGSRFVLNNTSATIILAEGTPRSVAFTNPGCNAEGLSGALVEAQPKGAFPLTIDGQSSLFKAGAEVQGDIQSFLIRIVPSFPDLSCREQPPTDPLTLKGYQLVPYTPPFDYPFNIPFQTKPPEPEE